MNVCKMATWFCKDVEAACVSQQCCAWDRKLQMSKKSMIILDMHDVFAVLPMGLGFLCLSSD